MERGRGTEEKKEEILRQQREKRKASNKLTANSRNKIKKTQNVRTAEVIIETEQCINILHPVLCAERSRCIFVFKCLQSRKQKKSFWKTFRPRGKRIARVGTHVRFRRPRVHKTFCASSEIAQRTSWALVWCAGAVRTACSSCANSAVPILQGVCRKSQHCSTRRPS